MNELDNLRLPSSSLEGSRDRVQSKTSRNLARESNTKLKDLAQQFESFLLNAMIKSMRKSVPDSGMTHGGHAEKIYQSMLDSEYALSMARQEFTGLSEAIQRQLGADSYKSG